MKTKTCIIAMLLAVGLTNSPAQDTWIRKADFGGTARVVAVGFSIGTKGYIGTGGDASGLKKDFWEYDPVTDIWTQKADFGGTARYGAVGFSIGAKGYVGTGLDDAAFKKDFWEYNPSTNVWTQKADFAGTATYYSAGFTIGAKGYIGTGYYYDNGYHYSNYLWEYDPATDVWSQKTDFPGAARNEAVGFSIGTKGYIGTGWNGTYYKDFWEYDPASDTWTQKADFGGTASSGDVGFSISSKGYIGTGSPSPYLKDFWEYDPSTDIWTQKADFGGGTRAYAVGFGLGGKGYIGTGGDVIGLFKDFWEYTPGGNATGCVPPPAGLVSWWSGDKTAQDVQGTYPGVLLNGTSFRPGKVGPGFVLDGVNDWVTIPNSNSSSQTRITLDAWVYPTGLVGLNRHILSKDYIGVGREYSLALNGSNKFAAFVTLPTGLVLLEGNTTPLLNTWYHVAMTHDGQELRLYVNGVLDGAIDAVGDTVPTQVDVSIGGGAYGEFFKGIIDEAQIFSRALTDAEILAIYQAGADGQCKPDIFVASIDPSFQVRGSKYLVSTAVSIQDENGIGTSGATVNVKTLLPNGSELILPAPTDESGTASFSFYTSETGLYKFQVIRVNHPTRVYDPSLNIETSDTLLIP